MGFKSTTVTVPTSECPCKGLRGWKWHSDRALNQCDHSRYKKNAQWRKDNNVVISDDEDDPGNLPWMPGTVIYFDEKEVMMA